MKNLPENIFRKHGGQLRMSDAIKFGISRYRLYAMRDRGIIEQVSRGVYRLVELPPITNPDLVTVSLRFPNSVICLVSALAFHEITTQIPHVVSVAEPRGSRVPKLDAPPIRVHLFSRTAFEAGIETHTVDGVNIKVYSSEKTLADCFKFRNKIGMDVVLEALDLYRKRMRTNPAEIMRFARICRVEKLMRPYLEAIT